MFDAATVTIQITNYHSLITFSRANSSFVFFFPSPLCVSLLLWQKLSWSHHRHVDYTRATFGPLHTFDSSTFLFPSLPLYFLAGTGVVFGIRKILNNRNEPADFRALLLPTPPLLQTGLGGKELEEPPSIWVLSSLGGSYGRK